MQLFIVCWTFAVGLTMAPQCSNFVSDQLAVALRGPFAVQSRHVASVTSHSD